MDLLSVAILRVFCGSGCCCQRYSSDLLRIAGSVSQLPNIEISTFSSSQ